MTLGKSCARSVPRFHSAKHPPAAGLGTQAFPQQALCAVCEGGVGRQLGSRTPKDTVWTDGLRDGKEGGEAGKEDTSLPQSPTTATHAMGVISRLPVGLTQPHWSCDLGYNLLCCP